MRENDMIRLIRSYLIVGLMLAVSGTAWADVAFEFEPTDFFRFRNVSVGFSTDGGMFKLHKEWSVDMYRSWTNDGGQRTIVDNWVAGLQAEEGIFEFNIWLLDNCNGQAWGETTVWNPDGQAPTGTSGIDSNWDVEVVANPWGTGWLVRWWTDDPASNITPNSDVGKFSFSGTPYHDLTGNGYDASDPAVQIGDVCTIWFGGAYAGTRIRGFESTLSLAAIPEPTTILIFGIGMGLVRWFGRRRTVG